MLGTEDVTIKITDDAIEKLAELAANVNEALENIGARRLQTVMEKLLEDISFDAEDLNGAEITIDGAYVDKQLSDGRQGHRSVKIRPVG